jgi:hypothetical protein
MSGKWRTMQTRVIASSLAHPLPPFPFKRPRSSASTVRSLDGVCYLRSLLFAPFCALRLHF